MSVLGRNRATEALSWMKPDLLHILRTVCTILAASKYDTIYTSEFYSIVQVLMMLQLVSVSVLEWLLKSGQKGALCLNFIVTFIFHFSPILKLQHVFMPKKKRKKLSLCSCDSTCTVHKEIQKCKCSWCTLWLLSFAQCFKHISTSRLNGTFPYHTFPEYQKFSSQSMSELFG